MQTNEDVKKEMRDMNITEGTLIDEIPSDSLDVEITDDATVVVEEELQEMNISQATLIDEMLPFDSLLPMSELPPPDTLDVKLTDDAIELTSDEAEETMEDSGTKAEDQFKEEQLQKVSTSNNEEDDIPTMIPVSGIEKERSFGKKD
ncbi:hypothetical protein Tco_1014014 [Tanacetum coccineum]